jgi:hypothetical protein
MQSQVVINKKNSLVNDHLAIVNGKLTKPDKVLNQFYDFFAKFTATHPSEQPIHKEGFQLIPYGKTP